MLRAPDPARWRSWLADVGLPELGRCAVDAPVERLEDPAEAARGELARVTHALPAAGRVAIAVGSRGIGDQRPAVAAVIDAVRAAGAEPILVPAMGSHGGATPEGQTRVLEDAGLTDLGALVDASMEVREAGRTPEGTPYYVSRAAADADAVVLVNRVKPHTGFRGAIESGLAKMLVVGLGKDAGARSQHAAGYDGFAARLAAARDALRPAYRLAFGLVLVENARGETAHVEAIPPSRWAEREPELLADARARMARLPFEKLDVLIVARAGKDVSGVGMDPNVTGRWGDRAGTAPDPTRIALLRLTPGSEGNANGMGLADVVPQRFLADVDPDATWINAATSRSPVSGRLPMVMPDEATAVRLALRTGATPGREARVVLLRDTAHVTSLYANEAAVASADAALRADGAFAALSFGDDGAPLVGGAAAFGA